MYYKVVLTRTQLRQSLKNFPSKDIHRLRVFLLNAYGTTTTEVCIDFIFSYIQTYRYIQM